MRTSRVDEAVHWLRGGVPSGPRNRWIVVLGLQVLILVSYLGISEGTVTAPRYLLYPFAWIDVSALAVVRASPDARSRRHRTAVAGVAGGYFLAMMVVAGFVGPGRGAMTGWRFVAAPPGWGPMIAYQGALLRLYLVPFQVVGYAALAYLFYAALLAASRGIVSGTLGLVSCVGCTWTVIAPFVAGSLGSASAISATVYSLSYDLTTAVFLSTVVLLYVSQRRGGP